MPKAVTPSFRSNRKSQPSREIQLNWFLVVMKKYVVFSGRAHRREYWIFALVACLIAIALFVVDIVTGTYDREAGLGLATGIFLLVTLLPSIAVGVRRLHDTGKSGWWWLISVIPLAGPLILLVICAQPGEIGDNRYGPDPKPAT
jgi:uncharacterized membrane protein YhaH (DUF805 family)